MNRWRLVAIVFIVFGAVAYLVVESLSATKQQLRSITSFSDAATGLSIFRALAEEVSPHGTVIRKEAFLDASDLSGVGTVLIASPLIEVSARESAQLRRFVEGGGRLILSFHDRQSRVAFSELLRTLGMEVKMIPDPDFKNSVYRRIKVNRDSVFARKGSILALYSAEHFEIPECSIDRYSCYVSEKEIGQGDVVLVNGVIPIANALVGREANSGVAIALAETSSGAILIDEYRHLFTEKTLTDLLTDVRVVTPLAVLFVSALAFFLFGDRDERVHEELFEERVRVPVYHDFARRVFLGSLEGRAGMAQAAEFNARCIEELFPEKRSVLAGISELRKDPERRLRAVLGRHRALLVGRGVLSAPRSDKGEEEKGGR